MTKTKLINKDYLWVNHQRCILCDLKEDFPVEDALISMRIHKVCLELLAYNLPSKAGKTLLRALTKK